LLQIWVIYQVKKTPHVALLPVGNLHETSTDFEGSCKRISANQAPITGIGHASAGKTAPHLGYQHGMV
jgi:hypothetical protein